MSLQSQTDVTAIPPKFIFKPTLMNYVALFSPQGIGGYGTGASYGVRHAFLDLVKNSLIVSIGAVLLSMITGVPAAYVFARYKFKFKEDIAFTLLSFRFGPEYAVIIPLYTIYVQFHLLDSLLGLILAFQLITLPFIVWVMRAYFESVPIDIENAARVEGYSWWAIFGRIALPVTKTGLASTVVLAFIFAWNNFMFPFTLAGRETVLLPVGALSFIGFVEVYWGQMAAASVVMIIPILLLAFFTQRYLVTGLTFGAVRG